MVEEPKKVPAVDSLDDNDAQNLFCIYWELCQENPEASISLELKKSQNRAIFTISSDGAKGSLSVRKTEEKVYGVSIWCFTDRHVSPYDADKIVEYGSLNKSFVLSMMNLLMEKWAEHSEVTNNETP